MKKQKPKAKCKSLKPFNPFKSSSVSISNEPNIKTNPIDDECFGELTKENFKPDIFERITKVETWISNYQNNLTNAKELLDQSNIDHVPVSVDFLKDVKRLCDTIDNNPPDSKTYGKINSLALKINHYQEMLNLYKYINMAQGV